MDQGLRKVKQRKWKRFICQKNNDCGFSWCSTYRLPSEGQNHQRRVLLFSNGPTVKRPHLLPTHISALDYAKLHDLHFEVLSHAPLCQIWLLAIISVRKFGKLVRWTKIWVKCWAYFQNFKRLIKLEVLKRWNIVRLNVSTYEVTTVRTRTFRMTFLYYVAHS